MRGKDISGGLNYCLGMHSIHKVMYNRVNKELKGVQYSMIDKNKLNQWVDQLPEGEQKTVFDFVQYLVHKHTRNEVEAFYDTISEVDELWSDEEKRQMEENSGWMELEELEQNLSKGSKSSS